MSDDQQWIYDFIERHNSSTAGTPEWILKSCDAPRTEEDDVKLCAICEDTPTPFSCHDCDEYLCKACMSDHAEGCYRQTLHDAGRGHLVP